MKYSPTGKRVPHKMRTRQEWMEIYRRAERWDGGVRNGPRKQCAACLHMFAERYRNGRFCSRRCELLYARARERAIKWGMA